MGFWGFGVLGPRLSQVLDLGCRETQSCSKSWTFPQLEVEVNVLDKQAFSPFAAPLTHLCPISRRLRHMDLYCLGAGDP